MILRVMWKINLRSTAETWVVSPQSVWKWDWRFNGVRFHRDHVCESGWEHNGREVMSGTRNDLDVVPMLSIGWCCKNLSQSPISEVRGLGLVCRGGDFRVKSRHHNTDKAPMCGRFRSCLSLQFGSGRFSLLEAVDPVDKRCVFWNQFERCMFYSMSGGLNFASEDFAWLTKTSFVAGRHWLMITIVVMAI